MTHLFLAFTRQTFELPFVPIWIADLWRGVNFVFAMFLLSVWCPSILSAVRREHRIMAFSAWGQAGLACFTVQGMAMSAEFWRRPLVLYGAPLFTAALVCGLVNVLAIRRAARGGHG